VRRYLSNAVDLRVNTGEPAARDVTLLTSTPEARDAGRPRTRKLHDAPPPATVALVPAAAALRPVATLDAEPDSNRYNGR
jgi:hypothetical protein